MAETLFTIGIVCLAFAGVGLILTAFLFIKLRIPSVIAELTGKTAKDAIKRMRAESNLREHGGRSLQSIMDASGKDNLPNSPKGTGNASNGSLLLPTERKYNLARTETGLLKQKSGLLNNNIQEAYAEQNSQYQVSVLQQDEDVSEEITERETAPLPLPPIRKE